jgi:hypothetical protein
LTQPQAAARLSGWQGGGQKNTAKKKPKASQGKVKPELGKERMHIAKQNYLQAAQGQHSFRV